MKKSDERKSQKSFRSAKVLKQFLTPFLRLFFAIAGDAPTVALIQTHGLTKLASNDPNFDRVPGLTRYAPA